MVCFVTQSAFFFRRGCGLKAQNPSSQSLNTTQQRRLLVRVQQAGHVGSFAGRNRGTCKGQDKLSLSCSLAFGDSMYRRQAGQRVVDRILSIPCSWTSHVRHALEKSGVHGDILLCPGYRVFCTSSSPMWRSCSNRPKMQAQSEKQDLILILLPRAMMAINQT